MCYTSAERYIVIVVYHTHLGVWVRKRLDASGVSTVDIHTEQPIRFRFSAHTRHLVKLTIGSAVVVVIAGALALLIGFRLLSGFDGLLLPAYIIAMCAVAILLLVLVL